MFCSSADDHPAGEAPGFRLESPLLQQRAAGGGIGVVRQTAGTEGDGVEPATLANGRRRNLMSRQAGSGGETVHSEATVALRGGARDLAAAATSDTVEVEMDAQADAGSCDPYDGGDEWCEAAISVAEQRALNIQGTNIYCR